MTRFHSSRRMAAAAICVLAGIFLGATGSRAEDSPVKPHRKENRFLFVIDTSAAMKARTSGVVEGVMGLLDSDMKGELRKGDTIGVWTYSDRLLTDFPMQVWSEQKKDNIETEVREYLAGLRYDKRSHLEKALPLLNELVASSERLTVILVFDGSDEIQGTPFDKDINDLHRQYAREFRTAHEPFVTLLASTNHAIFDYTINYPGAVVVPHTADPIPPPETNAPPVVAAIVPPPVEIPVPPPEPKPPPHVIEINVSGADFKHNEPAPPPATYTAPVAVTPTPTPAPAPIPTPAPAAVTPTPAPVEVAPIASQAPQTTAAPPEPQRAPPPTVIPPPAAPVVATSAKPVTDVPSSRSAPVAAMPAPPAVVAVSTLQQAAMFIMALSLLTIAVVLVLFLVRRSRGSPQPSLISQSIDRSR